MTGLFLSSFTIIQTIKNYNSGFKHTRKTKNSAGSYLRHTYNVNIVNCHRRVQRGGVRGS